MDFDGRHCETEQTHRHNANRWRSSKLLAKLMEVHGTPAPQPEPGTVVIVPTVVSHSTAPEVLPLPINPMWIKGIEEMPDPRPPSVNEIKVCVARHFNLSPRDLESPRRFAKIVRPRQIAFYLARKLTTRSFPDIGRRFGGKDHTTIIHSCKLIQACMETDPKLAETVRCLEEQLQ